MLRVRALEKSFGPVPVLRGVSLEVAAGECVAIVGESGSGKTTLLRCFNRLVEPDRGSIDVFGEDARLLDAPALRRRIGYVPQGGGLLPHWNVRRNVALVPRLLGMSDGAARAEASLSRVGLSPEVFASRWPRELSGGQRQRVALARALAAEPRLVLLDEPFGALDAITRSELVESFGRLRRELGLAAVLVTHDLREARVLADRIAVMRDGTLLQLDSWEALRGAPASGYVGQLLERSGALGP